MYNWTPCPTCTTPNSYGYVCPDPIPPTDTHHHDYSSTFHSHAKCMFCERSTPTDWKPYRCCVCSEVSCSSMFTCVQDATFISVVTEQKFFFTNGDDRLWPLFNSVEKAMLQAAREANPQALTWDEIAKMMVEHVLIPSNQLRSDGTICRRCAENKFEATLMRWWIWYKKEHGITDNRVNCWYGFQCRTQNHIASHAERYISPSCCVKKCEYKP
jgi:hypothetical protein